MASSARSSNGNQIIVAGEQARDVDRLEEMTADAAGAARLALELLPRLDCETFKPCEREMKYLAGTIEKRRILSDDFRQHIGIILHNLEAHAQSGANDPDVLRNLVEKLETARAMSHRVDDLLNAEKEINRQRSHRA